MRMLEIKTLMRDVILEEINKDQLNSTAVAIDTDPITLRTWVEKTDPTPKKSFSVWILRGLKKGDFRTEDEIRIRNILNRFIQLRNANKIEDIMKFPTIHDLETKIDQLTGVGSKRQGFAGVDPTTLPGVWEYPKKSDITYYRVSDVNSLAEIGEGTKWCTRKSYPNCQAKNYISRFGSLIVAYKDGKPFAQITPDYRQVKDVNDSDRKSVV